MGFALVDLERLLPCFFGGLAHWQACTTLDLEHISANTMSYLVTM